MRARVEKVDVLSWNKYGATLWQNNNKNSESVNNGVNNDEYKNTQINERPVTINPRRLNTKLGEFNVRSESNEVWKIMATLKFETPDFRPFRQHRSKLTP